MFCMIIQSDFFNKYVCSFHFEYMFHPNKKKDLYAIC